MYYTHRHTYRQQERGIIKTCTIDTQTHIQTTAKTHYKDVYYTHRHTYRQQERGIIKTCTIHTDTHTYNRKEAL